MKKDHLITVIIGLLMPFLINAQYPERGFNFQGIARDVDGKAITSENVDIKFTIYPDGGGTSWSEEQTLTTDAFGVFTAVIGSKQPNSFKNIDFSSDRYFLMVEVKVSGTYQVLSDTELLSVPYSKTSEKALTANYATEAFFPAGIIVPFGGTDAKVPAGWLLCDGQGLKSSEYPGLYNMIGTAWGNGSENCPGGGCNFNAPDLRGVFIRGMDGTRGQDPDKSGRTTSHAGGSTGNNVGSYQSDAMQNVAGQVGEFNTYAAIKGSSTGPFQQTYKGINTGIGSGDSDGYNTVNFDLSRSARTATETRSKNAYVNYIIKY
jgi:microcystin-dependent protein